MKKFLLFLYIFPCFIICGCHPFAHNKNPNSQNNFSSKQSSSTRSSMESVQEEAAASTQPNKSVLKKNCFENLDFYYGQKDDSHKL